MDEIDYVDFDLLIERSGEGTYRARVLSSPAGQAMQEVQMPYTGLELENFLLRVGKPRRGVRRLESPEMETVKAFGSKMFKSIFTDDLLSALRTSQEEAKKNNQGLRIRLRFNDAPELVNLPWEFLYNPALNRFFSLSVNTPVVRYLEMPERITPLAIKAPVRLLVMISSPSDYPSLDVEHEWNNLKIALCDLEERGLLEMERLETASPVALQYALRRKDFHIFHFIGHGGFNEQTQDGVLLLEDESGRGRPLSGQYLGTVLHDEQTLRLVVLNACEGGRSGSTDPFAGVAQSVVQQGMPAVIAMQFEITDAAAITFAREFYTAIAEGFPVDAAMSESRKAIYSLGNDIEWGTPVLYMRAPDGRIFDIPKVEPAQVPTPSSPSPARAAAIPAVELESLYTDGLSAYWLQDWAHAWEYFRKVEQADPNYKDIPSKITEVKRQLSISALNADADQAAQAGNWTATAEALEKLVKELPQDDALAARLETARKNSRLEGFYTQARQLSQAKQWAAVVKVFNQIYSSQPNYPDPDGLFPVAQQKAADVERQAKLKTLYNQALQALEDNRWQDSTALFSQVKELDANYKEVQQLLERAQAQLNANQLELKKQAELKLAYEQAAGYFAARQWQQALNKIADIRKAQPGYPDPNGIEAQAQENLTHEQAAARLKKAQDEQYALAAAQLRKGEAAQALATLEALRREAPAYPDPQKIQATAQKKLKTTGRAASPAISGESPTPRMRTQEVAEAVEIPGVKRTSEAPQLPAMQNRADPIQHPAAARPSWLKFAIGGGGLFLILVIIIGLVFSRGGSGKNATPTEPESRAVVVNPDLDPTSIPVVEASLVPTQEATEEPAVPTVAPESTPYEEQPESPPATTRIHQTLSDDFSSNANSWPEFSDDSEYAYITDGLYTLGLNQANLYSAIPIPQVSEATSVFFITDLTVGAGYGSYGVYCHYLDDQNFIVIQLETAEARYSIWQRTDGNWLTLVNSAEAVGLNVGDGAQNNLYFTCQDSYIDIWINGNEQGGVSPDPLVQGGQLYLYLITGDEIGEQGFSIDFDYVYADNSVQEIFLNNAMDWYVDHFDESYVDIENESYVMEIYTPEVSITSLQPFSFKADNISFSVTSPTSNGSYGVRCNWIDDANYYEIRFETGSSQYSLWQVKDGSYTALLDGEFLTSPLLELNGNNSINIFVKSCQPGYIEFSAENETLQSLSFTENSSEQGNIELFSQAYSSIGSEGHRVIFDNINILP
jgi:hypothetical protein